ncbi:hypothetical protein ACPPVO_29995 [Dactylosporangium sp. McL0621]|uniref:hypothetical protein n=1 Tax=Dactylosporangium sp. McL0621 TaxID=3415678 RepID=UPI003CF41634
MCDLSSGLRRRPPADGLPRRGGGEQAWAGTTPAFGTRIDTLLAVLGDDGINVARLHLEARPAVARLAAQLP